MTQALRPGLRRTLAVLGGFPVGALAAPTLAAAPTASHHRDGPEFECPAFTLYGEWDVTRRIRVFSDGTGIP